MSNALIGYSGFVGSTLLKQGSFDTLYRSSNIGEIEGKTFDTLVCAGAPAQKWIANREPEADLQKIEGLIAHFFGESNGELSLGRFILSQDRCGAEKDEEQSKMSSHGLIR